MAELLIPKRTLIKNKVWILIFLFIITQVIITPISAQLKSKAELAKAASIAFSGKDIYKKNGRLAKAGYDLALLVEEYKNHKTAQSLTRTQTPFVPSNTALKVQDGSIIVDIVSVGEPDNVIPQLKDLGMIITGVAGPIISGSLPISSIEPVALLTNVRFFHPSLCKVNVGATTSQGDVAMHSNTVRTNLGIDGSGVTVGVLSDSYNSLGGAAADVASGDLPGTGNATYPTPVNVIADNGTTDEGRGMLQLVHDVAPGATLAFATAYGGLATFANNITALRTTANADVIVDDVIYFPEPMFQDGVIAQAVDAAVAAGVPYFSSAGNQANKSYESVWRTGNSRAEGSIPSATGVTFFGGTTFDFDPGPGIDDMQSFTIANGQQVYITLQWDSPFASVCTGCPGSPNDLDIYLLNSDGTQVLARSAYTNITFDAYEILGPYTNTTGSTATYNLMIVKYGTEPDPGFIKYVNFGGTQGSLEYATNSSTIYGHANAVGAEAVGAVCYYYTPSFAGTNPPTLESFSSIGPTAVRFTKTGASTFDPRADKPEICAPDGTNTTFFGSDADADGFPNFFGTSAAAPHAAAIAALMLCRDNTLTPAQIYSNLEASAIDMLTPGFDNNSGYGFIQADHSNPLPVELVSFEVIAKKSSVKLNWKTATEVNNYGFEIQRTPLNLPFNQRGETGGFEKIGFVAGSGNSQSPKSYSFTDANVKNGKYIYRLKQVDLDGKIKYSDEREIEVKNTPSVFALGQSYPNPCNPEAMISFGIPEKSHVTLKVYNILGKEAAVLIDDEKEAGEYKVKFNGSSLSSGIYVYKLTAGKESMVRKMIVLK